MIIRCTKCSTEFALDPSQVGPEGVTLRCSVCSHMFHAEPDPDIVPVPWKLATADRQLVLPDLRRVLEHIEDGRLRPEDRVSRTGETWLKLGELPELSSLFIGAEGLPRVFRAMESSPAGDLGPPPQFGASVDEVRREETVRFNLASLAGHTNATPARRADESLPAPPDFDTALPAPPDFDAPVTRRNRAAPEPRSFQSAGPGRPAPAAPASMLEAVTKAVAGEERKRADVPDPDINRGRSQPILVADLARAAAASAEKAVQAVDGQRARERAERAERATGTFTGAMSRVDPSKIEPRGNNWSETRPAPRDPSRPATIAPRSSPLPPRTSTASGGPRETADLKLAAAAAREAELRQAAREAEPTQVEPSSDLAGGETAELTRPPEVVIVKMPEAGGRGPSAALFGLLGVAAAAGIVFGVPSIRERVFNLGGPTPEVGADPGEDRTAAAADTTPQELEQARRAIRNLGFKESNKVQAALQRVIDDPKRSPEAVVQARLTQAELVLMRALACKIAVTIEPAAMGGQAQSRTTEDPVTAQELLAGIQVEPGTPDGDHLLRVQALQALVEGKPPGPLPAGSEELTALIKGAPLWRAEVRTPPSGLITMLQRVASPSTLAQSVLALALWRGGDVESARTLLRTIVDRVGDQPAAKTMLEALDRQDMLAENGDPEVAVPPSDPEPEPTPTPEPAVDPTPPQPSGDGKVAVRPNPGAGATSAAVPVEVLISTGCQKVRQGDSMGVKMLLDAVDRGADPMQNFNLCFCLGAGFARQNSHDAALTWYKRAVTQSPANRDAVAGAARSAELLGRTAVAVDYYKKLRGLDPGNAAAAAYLAKHDAAHDGGTTAGQGATPPPDEPPGELMPIKPKNR